MFERLTEWYISSQKDEIKLPFGQSMLLCNYLSHAGLRWGNWHTHRLSTLSSCKWTNFFPVKTHIVIAFSWWKKHTLTSVPKRNDYMASLSVTTVTGVVKVVQSILSRLGVTDRFCNLIKFKIHSTGSYYGNALCGWAVFLCKRIFKISSLGILR